MLSQDHSGLTILNTSKTNRGRDGGRKLAEQPVSPVRATLL